MQSPEPTDYYTPPPLPVCDFCFGEPVWAYPCEDFDTGIVDPQLSNERARVTAGSNGAWCACEECAKAIESGDRRRLARRAAHAVKERKMGDVARQSLNYLQRLAEGVHSDFWKYRNGERRLLTDEEKATPPHAPRPEPTNKHAPVPDWLREIAEERRAGFAPDGQTTIDGETRGGAR